MNLQLEHASIVYLHIAGVGADGGDLFPSELSALGAEGPDWTMVRPLLPAVKVARRRPKLTAPAIIPKRRPKRSQ